MLKSGQLGQLGQLGQFTFSFPTLLITAEFV